MAIIGSTAPQSPAVLSPPVEAATLVLQARPEPSVASLVSSSARRCCSRRFLSRAWPEKLAETGLVSLNLASSTWLARARWNSSHTTAGTHTSSLRST